MASGMGGIWSLVAFLFNLDFLMHYVHSSISSGISHSVLLLPYEQHCQPFCGRTQGSSNTILKNVFFLIHISVCVAWFLDYIRIILALILSILGWLDHRYWELKIHVCEFDSSPASNKQNLFTFKYIYYKYSNIYIWGVCKGIHFLVTNIYYHLPPGSCTHCFTCLELIIFVFINTLLK